MSITRTVWSMSNARRLNGVGSGPVAINDATKIATRMAACAAIDASTSRERREGMSLLLLDWTPLSLDRSATLNGSRDNESASSCVARPFKRSRYRRRARETEYSEQHRRSEPSRIRILPAWMVRADERPPIGKRRDRPVPERGTRLDDAAARIQELEVGVKRNLPERDDDADAGERVEFRVEVREAVGDLLACRLVVGRRAADRGRDEGVLQCQPVVWSLGRRDVGEARAMQRGHQEIARAPDAVAGEHTAGTVCAMSGRGEAENQQSRPRIAEPRHRPYPVRVVAIRPPLLSSDPLAIVTQPRAFLAGYDRLLWRGASQTLFNHRAWGPTHA